MAWTRRHFLGGSLVFLSGCGRTALTQQPDGALAQRPEEDDMPQPDAGLTQPIILWGSVVAQPNADAAVPNEQLANPFEVPIEVLGMRFRVYPKNVEDNESARLTGSGVKVKLDIGKAAVASDIPINLFGNVRESFENGQELTNNGDAFSFPTTYDWKLRYPLFVPPGKVLSAVFTPIGINKYPVNIDVMYLCRTWDTRRPIPRVVKVPWATSFESKSFRNESDLPSDSDASSALDILNPFPVPLELSLVSGRCAALQLLVASQQGTVLDADYIYEDPVFYRAVRSMLRMRSSRGFDLIRTPVPFEGVFPIGWRAWDIPDGWQMAPQEYYTARLDVSGTGADVPSSDVSQAQFAIGIIGYRDVEVASLGGER